jgi:uncharacterized protein
MRKWLKAAAAVLLCCGPALAQDFDKGAEAYNHGRYGAALFEWQKLAEAGDAKAQYMLGQMYKDGKGVDRNSGEAIRWFRKSAEGGNPSAGYWLGQLYENGDGVQRNGQEAARWYKLAAEAGNVAAIQRLVLLYQSGAFVPEDPAAAERWTEIGGRKGRMELQLAAGLYYFGDGRQVRDAAKAEAWLKRAENPAERDDDGNFNYTKPQERRRTIAAAKYFLGALRETAGDNKAALDYYLASAELGGASAELKLAEILDRGGLGQARDRIHAFMWYTIALAHCDGSQRFTIDRIKLRRAAMLGELSLEEIKAAQSLVVQKHIPDNAD